MTERRLITYSYVSCAALAVGSLGPWTSGLLKDSVYSDDGMVALFGAGLAAWAIWRWTVSRRRAMLVSAWVVAVACVAFTLLAVGVYYADSAGIGWGLILTLIAASALVVLCSRLYRSAPAGERWSFNWPKVGALMSTVALLTLGSWLAYSANADVSMPDYVLLDVEPGPWSGSSRALDRKVLELRPGMSPDAVRSELGNPASGILSEDEASINYGFWQLTFTEEGLESWTRHYRPRFDLDSEALERRIMKLRLGASAKAVEDALGKPESIQVFDNPPGKEQSLWYAEWHLEFSDGALVGRYRF